MANISLLLETFVLLPELKIEVSEFIFYKLRNNPSFGDLLKIRNKGAYLI